MNPDRSYIVCATPRSGSTLVCHALEETGVAGRPEEYFEALRHSGRPRRPRRCWSGVGGFSLSASASASERGGGRARAALAGLSGARSGL